MKNAKRIFATAALLAGLSVICTTLQAQTAGKLVSATGKVEVQASGQAQWQAAANGQTLNGGDTVRTGAQSRAAILLADETQLKLNSNSQLQLAAVRQTSNLLVRVAQQGARADQSILNLSGGEAWVRSKKTPAAVRVNTPAVTAAIRGTEFDIKVAPDGESVATVVEGAVDYRNDQGFVLVNSGEQGRARVGQAPTKVVVLNPKDAVQWTLFYSGSVSPRDYPFVYASVQQARTALTPPPADPVRLAQLRHDAGDSAGALQALEGNGSAEAAEVRGWILLEQNRIPDAVRELNRAPAQSPRARLGLSLAHYRLNEFDEAYRLVTDPGDDGRLKVQRAMLDLMSGDVASASTFLQSVSTGDSAYALAQGLLSNIRLTQNDKDQALASARQAVAANAESPSALLNLSLAQQSFFDLPGATRSAEEALRLDPDFLQAQVQYAKLLFGAGQSGAAEAVARRALAVAPEEAAAHSTLGFILLAQAKTDEAASEFETSIRQDSSRGEPHLGLGIVNMRRANPIEAETEILLAVTLEPQIALYQSYLAKAFYEERKLEQAFSALQAAMELDPRDPTPYLYSGIFNNDLSRPGYAVADFERSIELNDFRAVYRSRFVLDEDRATRNVSLATAYNRLGLAEWANMEALKSNLSDPANSSAHLFLANTFLNLKGRTLAAGGELLLTRLLLPVNANSFNSFNDYTTLFELPRLNWTSEGRWGSFDSSTGTLISSGGTRRMAFSSVLTRELSDGYRPANDDSRNFTTVNFFKFALTPHSDVLLSYSHQQSRGGDHGSTFLVSDSNDPNRRSFVRTNRAEAGYHQRLRPGSELVAYFSLQQNEQVFDDPDALVQRIGTFVIRHAYRDSVRAPNVSVQASHLLKVSVFQLRYGLDIFQGRSRSRRVDSFTFPGTPPRPVINYCRDNAAFCSPDPGDILGHKDNQFRTGFLQSDLVLNRRLIVTAGINYDWANDNNDFDDDNNQSFAHWDPSGGVLFTPLNSTTIRFAGMRVLQTHSQARLVPAHINGFVLNLNEFKFSDSTSFNLGWDQRYPSGFFRASMFRRDRTTPITGELPSGDVGPVDFNGRFYGGSVVLNQWITRRLTVVPEYRLEHSEDLLGLRHDHEGLIGVYYVDPRRISANWQQRYLNQHGKLGGEPREGLSVWTSDFQVSYELPRKLGLIVLKVTNVFDRRYEFLADPLALDPRTPRRQASLAVRFNF